MTLGDLLRMAAGVRNLGAGSIMSQMYLMSAAQSTLMCLFVCIVCLFGSL